MVRMTPSTLNHPGLVEEYHDGGGVGDEGHWCLPSGRVVGHLIAIMSVLLLTTVTLGTSLADMLWPDQPLQTSQCVRVQVPGHKQHSQQVQQHIQP
jgi:hypothetical protein